MRTIVLALAIVTAGLTLPLAAADRCVGAPASDLVCDRASSDGYCTETDFAGVVQSIRCNDPRNGYAIQCTTLTPAGAGYCEYDSASRQYFWTSTFPLVVSGTSSTCTVSSWFGLPPQTTAPVGCYLVHQDDVLPAPGTYLDVLP